MFDLFLYFFFHYYGKPGCVLTMSRKVEQFTLDLFR